MSTQNINFDEGIREYTINNDPNRVIRVNMSDYAIFDRIKNAGEMVESYIKDIKNSGKDINGLEILSQAKDYVYKQVNYIFNSDVADIIFNGANPVSSIDGVTIYEKFIDVILPIITNDIETEAQKSVDRISKYTEEAEKFKNKVK